MSQPIQTKVIPPRVAAILAGRGFSPDRMAAFVYPSYESDLHDPFLLTDMTAAVDRLVVAAKQKDKVVVYGDYDIDGITASAVMIEGLAANGITASGYIPDRFEEGYGLNLEAMAKLKDQGADLVISVDCGITSVREAAWAKANGLDLIVTDHHAVPEVIPEAVAVINPKRVGDPYPFKDLAGVGVAFKLVQALQQRTGLPQAGQEKWLLDLVAMGTVCDVVTLVGENRVLVTYGLKVLRQTRRVGIQALAAVAGMDYRQLSTYHLGFVLGPRMNAAGRVEHAARSVELVMTPDSARATQIAQELDQLNTQRRADQAAIWVAADTLAASYADDPVLVMASEDWSHGVVGIVASKLVEKYHKPTLVMQIMGDKTKGSARSTGSFNMVEGLRAVGYHFDKMGGHYFAAGYTLPTSRIDALRADLNAYFVQSGHQPSPRPAAVIDLEVPTREVNDWELYRELELLEPYGTANPQPILHTSGLVVRQSSRIGKDATHLRLILDDGAGQRVSGIGFGLAERYSDLEAGQLVDAVYQLTKNEFRGETTLQLQIAELHYEH